MRRHGFILLIFALLTGCAHQPPRNAGKPPVLTGSTVTFAVQPSRDTPFAYEWKAETNNPVILQVVLGNSGGVTYQWVFDGAQTNGSAPR
jgi:hypothetical protein